MRSWVSSLPVDALKCRIPRLRSEVERLLRSGEVDLCVADFMAGTPNVPLDGPVPVVFFAHNVEHRIWDRLAAVESRGWRRKLLLNEARKMRRYEAEVCRQARRTLAVSEIDRKHLAAAAPEADVWAVPTGVDTAYFRPNGYHEIPQTMVFTGSMDWYPNEDALLYFIDAILPAIRREVPGARLSAVGRNPSPRLRAAAAAAGVTVTGRVDDVRPYMASAPIYVVPLRVGGGTRLKIFEALAMGKAVVSTTVGAEGLPLVPGEHFLCADEPEQFARAVVSLLRDGAQRRALGRAGRHVVEQRYSWPQVAQIFEARCQEILTEPAEAEYDAVLAPHAR
jgi:glycosyltransferase involved in cell wall biosynthesis